LSTGSSPHSLNHVLQVRTIVTSNCMTKHARLQPLSFHYHRLQLPAKTCSIMTSKLAWSWSPNALQNSLDYGLEVPLHIHLIMASKCIPNLTGSWYLSALSHSVDHRLQRLLWAPSVINSKCVFQFTPWYPVSMTMFKLARLQLTCKLQSVLIWCTQVVLQLCLSSVCCQIDCMYTYGWIQADNTCHNMTWWILL